MLYFYPNKPILIHPDSAQVQEKSDDSEWWAEIKKNGSRLSLRKSKEDSSKFKSFDGFIFNNYKEVLKYEPSKELMDELNSVNIPNGTHIDAELMHQKTKHIKHHIFLYDIYMYKGEQVFETLEVRRRMLEDIFKDSFKHFELSKIYTNDFHNLFNKVIVEEENEGLVLKSKKGKIVWNLKNYIEVWWQLKIRKTSNNYQF